MEIVTKLQFYCQCNKAKYLFRIFNAREENIYYCCYYFLDHYYYINFQVFAPLQTVTINGFKWNPAIWNEYRGFLEKAYKRFI